jgi:excisionase family DNA binding protein
MIANDGRSFTLSDNIEQILLKPKRAFELLDISRSTGYAMIASGELPSVRIGRAVRVPVDALKQWVKQQTRETNDESL